ncbi:glycoprotein-N-acetylgalactosamine 3-beta-galactosyltransferase 1-like [Haliotis rufescens]|uniref:glycoprotein-N-acetylgalactosamine 3-beta-galactosyltransferase 1-like n=1 Tax=Haliotis rufescens TaxID=6454 RepID=UPI00201EFAE2|nr:glycoprotein-N-acetylgalactosamine 3-beta-galactosyltransferase 1-like [Haliotis rufescens]
MKTSWTFYVGMVTGILVVLTLVLIKMNTSKWKGGLFPRDMQDGLKHTLLTEEPGTSPPGMRGQRILCWILTQPKNLKNRTLAVKETWGGDCDITLYFSSVTDRQFPTIGLGIPEKRKNLIKKVIAALQYIDKFYSDKADWFLKADDDTFIIVDNLRHFLRTKDPDAPVYYGCKLEGKRLHYHSGGGGYVMSKNVLRKFVQNVNKSPECTMQGAEDAAVGRCLNSLGVHPSYSVDQNGYFVFHWSSVFLYLVGITEDTPNWVIQRQPFWSRHNVASNVSVSFHYARNGGMRAMHFLLNNLTVHGYRKPTVYRLQGESRQTVPTSGNRLR